MYRNNKYFNVYFDLDSGSEVNILQIHILNDVELIHKLNKTNVTLSAYGNFKLAPKGHYCHKLFN